MKLYVIVFLLAGLGNCSQSRADNLIQIDQVGTGNTVTIDQQGDAHTASVKLGATSSVDYTTIAITQQGTGAKTANVEIKSGINNSASIQQDGNGNHTASIMNFNGSANQFNISQNGAGNHTFNVIGGAGTTNDANVLNAQQTGGAGADKTFNLWLNGTTGANVTVQQTNPTQANTGSMSITCTSGSCGSYSYIRN